jgi:hypothetical protein
MALMVCRRGLEMRRPRGAASAADAQPALKMVEERILAHGYGKPR